MEIEKNIEIPTRTKGRPPKKPETLAAHKMEIGDSVLCMTATEYENVRGTVNRNGGRITSRKMDGGWRVWRVA